MVLVFMLLAASSLTSHLFFCLIPQNLWFFERRGEVAAVVVKTEFLETSVISFSVKQQCIGPT